MTSRTNKGANSGHLPHRQFEDKTLSTEQILDAASSFTWKELEFRFCNVQLKAPVGDKVAALFTRTESHTGSVTDEWRMKGSAAWRIEFEQLASIAARKLGYISTEDVTRYWLGKVREWMIREKLDKNGELAWWSTGFADFEGNRDTTQHLITERIADLSAMFCVNLMAHGAPESAVSPPQASLKARSVLVESDPVRDGLRKAADEMRKKNPHMSDLQISKALEGKTVAKGLSAETIRKKIR